MFSPLYARASAGNRLFAATACVVGAAVLSLLSGCGSGIASSATPSITAAATGLKGAVHGGQQPVTGSSIYLFSVGTTNYGSAGTSLITTTAPGVNTDTSGRGYITSDSSGNFNLTQYTCAAGDAAPTYLIAEGGNPGLVPAQGQTISNSAIILVAALGQCSAVAGIASVNINELSTVAAVTALQQFVGTDVFHIGASAGNATGIAVSMGLATDLVPYTAATASTTNVAGNGSVPQAKINTLGNILSDCVNSSDSGQAGCTSLFSAATPPNGTAPSDIFGAMFDIAQNPTNNVSALYKLPQATAPFSPSLGVQPVEFSLAISYTDPALTDPTIVAIDAAGDAYVLNCATCQNAPFAGTDAILGFAPKATRATVTTNNVSTPQGLAIDNNGDLWTTNAGASTIAKNTGTAFPPFAYSSGVNVPLGIAIDASNTAWVADPGSAAIISVTNGGAANPALAATQGMVGVAPSDFPVGVGIDGVGSVFVSLNGTSRLLKIPISTPANAVTYTPSSFDNPEGITIDGSDFIYTINNNSLVSKVSSSGVDVTGSPFAEGVSNAQVIALDSNGFSWIADTNTPNTSSSTGSLVEATAAGVQVHQGLFDAHLINPLSSAIDPSGNVWVANGGSESMTEFIGVAAPVITPLAAAVKANKLTTRP